MYCPICGTKCEDAYYFCYKCGFQLPKENPESAPAAPPPVSAEEPAAAEVIAEAPAALPTEIVLVPEPPTVEEPAVAQVTEDPPEPAADPLPPLPCAEPVAAPAIKQGSLRVPALVLGAMMILGLALYFLFPNLPDADAANSTPWFSVTSGVLFFDESLYTGGSELEIPETVGGQTVTVIATDCFRNCDSLTSIILPDTVVEIGDRAFSGCDSLRGIFIPDGVTQIGSGAFAKCTALEAIHLPASITSISDDALALCPKLKHIFYAGTHQIWRELYTGTMPSGTWVYCEDGNFTYK